MNEFIDDINFDARFVENWYWKLAFYLYILYTSDFILDSVTPVTLLLFGDYVLERRKSVGEKL